MTNCNRKKNQEGSPTDQGYRKRLPDRKLEIYIECKFINQRNKENFAKLRRTTEESNR